eukprot:CAMPEP_0116053136 /NCGR_PEP_ID=MMETSP0322-20121206/2000_1 /TAXON_ID=163516 /ORGANISM="Leptocylindrus danicus var. apora, Strain B651" /LENGTH=587 /DNA_ID=CAMNT_0003536227 /DNA_START=88 /DNA_END=1848 /DNA_ORIENTATION=-
MDHADERNDMNHPFLQTSNEEMSVPLNESHLTESYRSESNAEIRNERPARRRSLSLQNISYPTDIDASGVVTDIQSAHASLPVSLMSSGKMNPSSSPSNRMMSDIDDAMTSRSTIDSFGKCMHYTAMLISIALLAFSLCITFAVNIEDDAEAEDDYNIPGAVTLLIVIFLLVWLATLEGGMVCLLGCQPIDPQIYFETHPIAYKCTVLASLDSTNLSRFIAGKQFLVVILIFIVDQLTKPVEGRDAMGISGWVSDVFLYEFALAMTFITLVMAQIVPQLIAKDCMLDFLNNHFSLMVIYASLAIEYSGLLHVVYLVPLCIRRFTSRSGNGEASEMLEDPAGMSSTFLFWLKVAMSSIIYIFSLTLVITALFDGNTEMWDDISPGLSLFLFVVVLMWGMLLQGVQVAIFALMKLPSERYRHRKTARLNFKAVFNHGSENVDNFLIGRQLLVTAFYFFMSKITHLDYPDDDTIWGVSQTVHDLLSFGLFGALVTTIPLLGGRIAGAVAPTIFLSNILILPNIYLCRYIGASEIVSVAWPICKMFKSDFLGWFKKDSEFFSVFAEEDNASDYSMPSRPTSTTSHTERDFD